jgi:hypothetical protein
MMKKGISNLLFAAIAIVLFVLVFVTVFAFLCILQFPELSIDACIGYIFG